MFFRQENINTGGVGKRGYHISTVYDNRIYVFGGYNGTSNRLGDYLVSNDAKNWKVYPNLKDVKGNIIPARNSGAFIQFNNGVYLTGGRDSTRYFNDVYYTQDMVNYTKRNDLPFQGRDAFAAVVFAEKVWILGGRTETATFTNDVYSTADMVNFQKKSNIPWKARNAFVGGVIDGKMFIFGGSSSSGKLNDIWYTSDGENWEEVKIDNGLPGVSYAAICNIDNKHIIVAGGSATSSVSNKCWLTSNGISWTELYHGIDIGDSGIFSGTLEYFNGEIVSIFGRAYQNGAWVYMNNVHILNENLIGFTQ